MLSVHNEVDIIGDVIENHLAQGLDVVALDNGSSDGAYDVCASYRDRGELVLDRWAGIDLGERTRRLYRMALDAGADWLLWSDGDDLLQAVEPGRTLRDVIEEADATGSNLIQFDRFDFFMTDRDDRSEESVPARIRHYSWQGDFSYRAWKYVPGIRAETTLAHLPLFPETVPYRIYPRKQVYRHYPSRNPAQAQAKLDHMVGMFDEDPAKRSDRQHRYVRLAAEGRYARTMPAERLARLEAGVDWRREPLFTPFIDRQPTRSELFTDDGRLATGIPRGAPLDPSAGEAEGRLVTGSTKPATEQRKALIVLGMHRSGTSALARLLILLGADPPSNVMPADSTNETGHWEPLSIVDLDDEIFASVSSRWDDVSPLHPRWSESSTASAFHDRAVEVLDEEYGDSRLFVVKDPRMCRLVPFWRSAIDSFGAEPLFLIPVRNPLEVAASLEARDGIVPGRGLLLWLRHMLEVELGTRDAARAFISYERLLEDWRGTLERASEELGVTLPLASERAAVEVERFLSTRHRHHNVSTPELEARPEVVEWVKSAYAALEAAAVGGELDRDALETAGDRLDDAELAFGSVVAELQVDRDRARTDLEASLSELDERRTELDERGRRLELAERRKSALEEAVGALEQGRAQDAARLEALSDQLQAVADQLQQREGALAERAAQVERLSAQLQALSGSALGRAWRRIDAARRSASQIASWIFRKPSRARLRYVRTYFALKRSGAFDAEFYAFQSPDVVETGQNLLMHYIEHGAREGRDPSPSFKTLEHVARHPTLLESGLNPLLHQIKYVGPIGLPGPDASSGLDAAPRMVRRAEPSARTRKQEAREGLALAVSTVPRGSTVLFAGYDETDLVKSSRVRSRLFRRPAPNQAVSAGSTSAMARLQALRAEGADYLVLPPDASVWLSRDARFGRYLDRHYRVAASAEAGVVFDIRRQAKGASPWPGLFESFVAQHEARFGAQPDVLDCGTKLRLAERFSELTVIQPPAADADRLPYLADSIDLVVTGADTDGRSLDEARRVARNGIVSARQDHGSVELSIEWLRSAEASPPSVSIVIPTYNGADLLEPCLAGLVETVPRHLEVELIVIDDGSTDETSGVIARWSDADERVRSVRNAENVGFLDSCNRGAGEATGEALVFINNDTLPIHGWLEPLIRTLFQSEGVGAVGGMLVYPDGTLQEAGAVVFSDGTGANLGKHDPEPDRPRYRFVRDVDYCSAALLATRRATFEQLAGFDTLFRPGYYEETDYCFRARATGLRTVYQPESIVVHIEGATSGTDAAPREPKRHQELNRVRFIERWSDALRRQPSRPTGFDEATWNQLVNHRPYMARRSTGDRPLGAGSGSGG